MCICSGLTAIATYLLTKELWDSGAALFAACFIAISECRIDFSYNSYFTHCISPATCYSVTQVILISHTFSAFPFMNDAIPDHCKLRYLHPNNSHL